MDITPYLPVIFVGLVMTAGLFALGRTAGEAALIRLADQQPGAAIWQVWRNWRHTWRQGWLLGWSLVTWRLIGLNLAALLAALPAGMAALACVAVPLGGELFSGAVIPPQRLLVAGLLALVLLAILSIPLSVLGAYLRLAQRAAVLEDCGVFAALRRAMEVTRHHFQEVFVLWLVIGTFQFLYALVILPVFSFLSISGITLAWVVGAAVYAAVQTLAAQQTAFVIAVLLGGLVFLVVLYLPLWLIGGLVDTYVSVSWTHTYRELVQKMTAAPAR